MKAVQNQVAMNSQQSQSFFSTLIAKIEEYLNSEISVNKKNSVYEACCSVLLLAPVFKVIKEHVGEGDKSEL